MRTRDGRGLPPAAEARLDGPNTSLLTVPGLAGTGPAGFTVVGSVLGSVVHAFGWSARNSWALGTAVRAQGKQRSRRVSTTELPGQDVAKLMAAGWAPARVAIGVAGKGMATRYRRPMVGAWKNTEVPLATQLAIDVRAAPAARTAGSCRTGRSSCGRRRTTRRRRSPR